MPVAYEYAVLTWVLETNWSEIRNLPELGRPQPTWTSRYEFWLTGTGGGEEMTPGAAGVVDILDKLGQSGWRLVDASILDTFVTGLRHGAPDVGTPLKREWTFMRERQS